jgi:hypothetical protein
MRLGSVRFEKSLEQPKRFEKNVSARRVVVWRIHSLNT